ncbi:hypothetical protein Goshw_007016, partial [Gossypium schwendimanii]|nr:hypothetical protein [Gossypium schwendimanii]
GGGSCVSLLSGFSRDEVSVISEGCSVESNVDVDVALNQRFWECFEDRESRSLVVLYFIAQNGRRHKCVIGKTKGYEAWDVGKIMAKEKVNKEAMYRVPKSLWFINEEVSFVALNEEVILVKFGNIEDRTRILNLMLWLFDQCLFAMLPFIKGQELDAYEFNITPFLLRIYNIPLEHMDSV